jgi:hypothetical protein
MRLFHKFVHEIVTALPISPIWPNFAVNGLDWQWCLADSSKNGPWILIFLIAMGADYSFEKCPPNCTPKYSEFFYLIASEIVPKSIPEIVLTSVLETVHKTSFK